MTTRPFVLVQLSDTHLGAEWGGRDPASGLARAVKCVADLQPPADAVLVTGDLADHATAGEYESVRELLSPLGAPVLVLPGNHDERAALRDTFVLPGAGTEPVRYAAELGQGRLVVLDSTLPGSAGGQLDPDQLGWLESELSRSPDRPTVLAMHHPPITTGLPAADAIGVEPAAVASLAGVIGRHPQVRKVLAGHVHRVISADIAERPVLVAPSTYVQLRFNLVSEEIVVDDEPPAFAVHLVDGADVISHIVAL